MSCDRKKQIIAANNILFGTGYFLILDLPDGWGMTRSYLGPDIHSTVKRDFITWVEVGQSDQVLLHRQRKVGLDLMVQIRKGKREKLEVKGVQISSQGQATAGGHPSSYCLGEVKEGLFKKKIRKTLRVNFYCPELQRTVILHFTGSCQDSDLKEILESLAGLECH